MAILLASLPCFSSPSWTPVPFPSRVRGFPCYSLLPLRPPQLLHELLPFCQQNSDERCKFAKRLLLMIRLHLISDRSLQNNLDRLSVFTDYKECATRLNSDLFKIKKHIFKENWSVTIRAGIVSKIWTQNKYVLVFRAVENKILKIPEE